MKQDRVYFARCIAHDGYDLKVWKIGSSMDPETRASQVGYNSPFRCVVEATAPGNLFHEFFCHFWLRQWGTGGEFFRDCEEIRRIVGYMKANDTLPFSIKNVGGEGDWRTIRPAEFMERHGISFKDIADLSGTSRMHYQNLLKTKPSGNRRFLAALCVTAVRKGVTIKWPRDFFLPAKRLAEFDARATHQGEAA